MYVTERTRRPGPARDLWEREGPGSTTGHIGWKASFRA
ncbi:hypothetical protein MINT15_39480 [Saccharomonospora viridis]|uniref:Uncharacterized protein n=1 Tax=Saccharomonospora viridis TaxID=1852 RepID=A0A837D3J8_9PSEU|nr:hypothetical protein MINT15_39480 [Saccharomonospora viridis]